MDSLNVKIDLSVVINMLEDLKFSVPVLTQNAMRQMARDVEKDYKDRSPLLTGNIKSAVKRTETEQTQKVFIAPMGKSGNTRYANKLIERGNPYLSLHTSNEQHKMNPSCVEKSNRLGLMDANPNADFLGNIQRENFNKYETDNKGKEILNDFLNKLEIRYR